MVTQQPAARARVAFDQRPDLPIALVVGAGGMSMAIAHRLGQSHRVVLASLRSDELEQGQDRLHESGIVSTACVCDITDPQSVFDLGRHLVDLGPVQTLAHVAALSPSMGDWRSILTVNLIGAARIEAALHPLMAQGGAAIFISSLAAHAPEPDARVLEVLDAPLLENFFPQLAAAIPQPMSAGSSYALSKMALNRMVRRRALPWGRRGSRILSLSPGLIDTAMGAVEDAHTGKDTKGRLRSSLPIQRDGSMTDIADAVEFLASRRASYITGTDLLVDGGLAASLRFSAS